VLVAAERGYRRPVADLDEVLSRLDACAGAPVVFFGDSVAGRIAHDDVDQRTLGDMLADELGGDLRWIWHSAYHVEMYLELYRALLRLGAPPERLLVSFNLRGLSPQWHLTPSYAHRDHHAAIRHHPAPAAPVPPPPRLEGWRRRRTPIGSPLLPGWTIGKAEKVRAKKQGLSDAQRDERTRVLFAFHYGVPVTADHPRLQALRELAALTAANGTTFDWYVAPVNVAAAAQFGGQPLLDIIRSNIELVGGTDLSESVDREDFFKPDSSTEHLNERGRKKLASRMADLVRR
jgi:hypothetical protein